MPPRRALASAAIAALLLTAARPAHAQSRTISGRATVIDGETLDIHGTRIRLAGIAEPADDHVCERTDDEAWRCGPRAVNALDQFLEESVVMCTVKERDATGQAAATCTAHGLDLALWLIRNGLARAAGGAANARYAKAQDEAKAARRGMWAAGVAAPEP